MGNVALPIKLQLAVQHFYMLCHQWNAPEKISLMTPCCVQVGFHWGGHNGGIPKCSIGTIYPILCPYHSTYIIVHLVPTHCILLLNIVKLCGHVLTIYAMAWSLLLANLYFWCLSVPDVLTSLEQAGVHILSLSLLITLVVLCYWRSNFCTQLIVSIYTSFPDSYLAAFDLFF